MAKRDGAELLRAKAAELRDAMAAKGFALSLDEAGALGCAGFAATCQVLGVDDEGVFVRVGRLLAGSR